MSLPLLFETGENLKSTAIALRTDVFVKATQLADGEIQALLLDLGGNEIYQASGVQAQIAVELRRRSSSHKPAAELSAEIARVLGGKKSEIESAFLFFDKLGLLSTEVPPSTIDQDEQRLATLENESIFIIREAARTLKNPVMLWSMGKDSTVMLWLTRKAFFGRIPFPILHIDTSFKIPEMLSFREQKAAEWGLDLIVRSNQPALQKDMQPQTGRLECCTALKTDALKHTLQENGFSTIFAAIRGDEEGSRGKERIISPRGPASEWNYREQPPELWNEYQTDFPEGTEVRVHPILRWSELDVWLYIQKHKIPVLDLYFAKNGRRYRSVGCAPCTKPIESRAATLEEVIAELRTTRVGERAGRAQDQADRYAMQKLRAKGYM